ncbi:hypothetical protein B7463_g12746, partial [Scytalidium lignicola]
MDPHDLAIAALDAVVAPSEESTGAGRDQAAGNVALERSREDDATDGGMRRGMSSSEVEMKEQAENRSDGTNMQPPVLESEGPENKAIVTKVHQTTTTTEILATSLQSTSSLNSQSTDLHDGTSTSPTSEGFSSQSTNPDGPLSQLSQLAAAQAPLSTNNPEGGSISVVTTSTAGQKRTADGQVKTPISPNGIHFPTHSRNASNASSVASRLGELSSELRTRLSYAMVKVNNGWTSNSIDEVETLASQAGSPASSTSTLQGRRNLITSPRTNIASFQIQPSTNIPLHQDFDLYSRSEPTSRTYESFWRDHSSNSASYYRQSSQGLSINSPRSTKISLGPPADIHPSTHPRRTDAASFSKPPNLPGQSTSDMSQYSQQQFHSPTPTPRTPIRGGNSSSNNRFQDGAAGIRTPTQKTIQEQDAIETLLFMSSPGNSGNLNHAFPPPSRSQTSPQRSPLRTEFSPHIKGTPLDVRSRRTASVRPEANTINGTGGGGGHYNAARAKMTSMDKNDRAREEAIDQLLDEMGDSSSDEELADNLAMQISALILGMTIKTVYNCELVETETETGLGLYGFTEGEGRLDETGQCSAVQLIATGMIQPYLHTGGETGRRGGTLPEDGEYMYQLLLQDMVFFFTPFHFLTVDKSTRDREEKEEEEAKGEERREGEEKSPRRGKMLKKSVDVPKHLRALLYNQIRTSSCTSSLGPQGPVEGRKRKEGRESQTGGCGAGMIRESGELFWGGFETADRDAQRGGAAEKGDWPWAEIGRGGDVRLLDFLRRGYVTVIRTWWDESDGNQFGALVEALTAAKRRKRRKRSPNSSRRF